MPKWNKCKRYKNEKKKKSKDFKEWLKGNEETTFLCNLNKPVAGLSDSATPST